jgi:hypothetical protein
MMMLSLMTRGRYGLSVEVDTSGARLAKLIRSAEVGRIPCVAVGALSVGPPIFAHLFHEPTVAPTGILAPMRRACSPSTPEPLRIAPHGYLRRPLVQSASARWPSARSACVAGRARAWVSARSSRCAPFIILIRTEDEMNRSVRESQSLIRF